MIKSIDISVHGFSGVDNGCKSPVGHCIVPLHFWQIGQAAICYLNFLGHLGELELTRNSVTTFLCF